KAGIVASGALVGLRETEMVTEQIHQLSRILAIMNGEVTVKSDLVRIFAQQSAADRMECPRPGQGINHQSRLFRQDLRGDPLNPADHLLRRSPGKGEEHDATRINAPNNEMGHTVGERLCLSRTCPCIDEQRPNTVLHSMALFRVERNEMRIGHRFGIESQETNRGMVGVFSSSRSARAAGGTGSPYFQTGPSTGRERAPSSAVSYPEEGAEPGGR